MGFKIYIFRHGQTELNRDNRFTGHIQSNLTKTGKEDAKIIAERLKDKKFEVAFHTSLNRSKDTLKEVLKYHKECKRIIVDDRMIERDYGKLSGKSHWQIISKEGYKKYDAWHRSFDSAPPNGEDFSDVEKRVKSFVDYLIKFIRKEKVNVAIAAHGNSIRLFRKIMEKATEKEACSWFIPYDQYFEYEID